MRQTSRNTILRYFLLLSALSVLFAGCATIKEVKPSEAARLANEAMQLYLNKNYKDARERLAAALQIEPQNADAVNLQKTMRADSEDHCKRGNKFLYDENYQKAIAEFQIALELDPDNKNSRKSLVTAQCQKSLIEAKELLKAEKFQEARKRLRRVLDSDTNNKEARDIIERMNRDAEAAYKNGIKLYTQEKIDRAIVEWKKTLVLNPEHKNASKDLEDAQRLQEKLKNR